MGSVSPMTSPFRSNKKCFVLLIFCLCTRRALTEQNASDQQPPDMNACILDIIFFLFIKCFISIFLIFFFANLKKKSEFPKTGGQVGLIHIRDTET